MISIRLFFPVVCTGIFARPSRGDKAHERIRSESASRDFSSDKAGRPPDVQGLSELVISIYSMLDFPGVHFGARHNHLVEFVVVQCRHSARRPYFGGKQTHIT